MSFVKGTDVRLSVVDALAKKFPEIVEAAHLSDIYCNRETNPNECKERQGTARAHLDLVEKLVDVSLAKADANNDAKFTIKEVAAATEFALKSYHELRNLCTLPRGPAEEGPFYRCLMKFYSENVR